MPTIESVLCEKTHKADVHEVEKRIFYTLTDIKGSEAPQTAKALALLIKCLHEKGILDDQEIDDLLLGVVT